jgi:hypothetical protein
MTIAKTLQRDAKLTILKEKEDGLRFANPFCRLAVRCSIAVILYAFAPTHASDNLDEPPTQQAFHLPSSVDSQSVSVRLGPLLYDVPRNYLAGVTQPRATNSYAAFTIRALLPDLSPRTNQKAQRLDEIGWHNEFSALFEYDRHPRSPEEVLESYLKDDGISQSDFRPIGAGYRLYQNPKTSWREIYTKETPNGLLLFICGTTANGTPFPSCTVNESVGENIGVIYHFGRDHLNQASDIDLKLRALLKSFEAK